MSSRAYSVETRNQAALIIGGHDLVPFLVTEFKARGIYALAPTSLAEFTVLCKTHDLDYLLVFSDSEASSWLAGEGKPFISPLQSLIQSGTTRLILVRHYLAPTIDLPLSPVGLELLHADYLGGANYLSPILHAWALTLKQERSLLIPGDGLTEIGLLDQNDLVRGLVEGITRPHPQLGSSVFLTSVEPISILNLAYNLRPHLSFKVKIIFDQNLLPPGDLPPLAVSRLVWDQTTKLADLIASFVKTFSTPATPPLLAVDSPPPTKLSRLYPSPVFVPLRHSFKSSGSIFSQLMHRLARPRPPISTPHPHLRPRAIIGRGLLIALGIYLGSLTFAATLSTLFLRQIVRSISLNSLPPQNSLVRATTTYLEANLVTLSLLPGIGQSSVIQDSLLLLDSYQQILVILQTSQTLAQTTGDLVSYVLGGGQGDAAQLLSQSRLFSEELYTQLSLLDGTLPADPPSILPGRYTATYHTSKSKLSRLKRSVLTTKAVLSITPDLIGLGGRKKYAVLFQNNSELRATGGFLGSFAILSFENGQLYDLPVYDSYTVDAQLKGRVDPPRPIKDILGESNWYLRDSNFDPNFPATARRVEWFIQKTLNQNLDGTIALNIDTFRTLLESQGALPLADYNETISAGNIYERAQYYAEGNFLPGSNTKRDFLSSVAESLFTTLSSKTSLDQLKLAEAFLRTIDAKNTLISVVNPLTDRVFSTLNWNGALQDSPDSAMVVDSNFGVNKANYFIRRSIQAVITLDSNLAVNHILRLRYTNTSQTSAWPAGPYKNYQRLYLPPSATIRKLKVDGQEIPPSAYSLATESRKTVLSHVLMVPINTTVGVEIEYQTPSLTGSSDQSYSWYWQKQPGSSSTDDLSVYLHYPASLKPTLISPLAELGVQQLKFDLLNDTDHRLSIKF
ncbi:MAG: DUF4012 domain-containing protein [bacterium]